MESQETFEGRCPQSGVLVATCPHCGSAGPVRAEGGRNATIVAQVIVQEGLDGGQPFIDWANADIEAEFDYLCDHCGEPLAGDCAELGRWLREGVNGAHLE